jgi:hypothetical protein
MVIHTKRTACLFNVARGNNLTEVLLPATLIGVVLISGVSSLLPTLTEHSIDTVNGTYLNKNRQIATAPLGQNPLLTEYTLKLEDGSSFTIRGLPASISKSIETVGVSGTTTELLASFVKTIDQLLKDGKISLTEANMLRTLADKGFSLSNNQSVIEQAALTCGQDKPCLQSALANNPALFAAYSQSMLVKSTSASKLLENMVPLQSEANLSTLKKLNPNVVNLFLGDQYVSQDPLKRAYIGKDLAAFIAQYQAVESNETLSSPVKSLTQFLSTNIFAMTHMNAVQAGRAANYFSKTDSANGLKDPSAGSYANMLPNEQNSRLGQQVESLKLAPPSELIARDSTHICTLGEGQVANRQCH